MIPEIPQQAEHDVRSATTRWLLLGVCGAGMRAFTEILLDAGHAVAGMDLDEQGMRSLQTRSGPRCQLLPWSETLDLSSILPETMAQPSGMAGSVAVAGSVALARSLTVVHSLAVSPMNPLLVKARAMGATVLPLPQALGLFLRNARQICVAGTHGKTTTSGMIWWVLQQAGLAPAGFVGGEIRGSHQCGSFGQGRLAVLESCEYRQSFLQLNPQTVVLTGIEPDHFDYFSGDQAADQTFQTFLRRIPGDGSLLVNAGSPRAQQAALAAACAVQTFGRSPDANWAAEPLFHRNVDKPQRCDNAPSQVFAVRQDGRSVAEVSLRIPGLHNLENGVAAFAALSAEGLSADTIVGHLATFPGMCRRFEYRGRWRGVDLIDDYAHHPSAIRATCSTARSVFPGRRIIAVFEPHQISRLENLFTEFALALSAFDECLILPVLPARETATPAECSRSSGNLVRRISEAGGRAFLLANLDQVPGRLDHAARPGDVVITMGAGRTHQIHDEIHRRLHRDSAA